MIGGFTAPAGLPAGPSTRGVSYLAANAPAAVCVHPERSGGRIRPDHSTSLAIRRRPSFTIRTPVRFVGKAPATAWTAPRCEAGPGEAATKPIKRTSALKLRDWFEVLKRKEKELADVSEVLGLAEGARDRLVVEESAFDLPPGQLSKAITSFAGSVAGVLAYYRVTAMQLDEYEQELAWAAEAENRARSDEVFKQAMALLERMKADATAGFANVGGKRAALAAELRARLEELAEAEGEPVRKDVLDALEAFDAALPEDPRDAKLPGILLASKEDLLEAGREQEEGQAEGEGDVAAAAPRSPPPRSPPPSPGPRRVVPPRPLLSQETLLFWSKLSSEEIGSLEKFLKMSSGRREAASSFVPAFALALFLAIKSKTFLFGGEEAIDAAILAGETWYSGWLPWALWTFGAWVASYPLTLLYASLSVPWEPEDGPPSLTGLREVLVNRRRLLEKGPEAFPIRAAAPILYDIVRFFGGGGPPEDGSGPPGPKPGSKPEDRS